jgi:hypothetical protein
MLSARKLPGSAIGQLAAAGIGTVAVGVLQSGTSGSGTAGIAGASRAEITGAGSAAVGVGDGRGAVFETATDFGVGLDACARAVSARAPSAMSRAPWGLCDALRTAAMLVATRRVAVTVEYLSGRM